MEVCRSLLKTVEAVEAVEGLLKVALTNVEEVCRRLEKVKKVVEVEVG